MKPLITLFYAFLFFSHLIAAQERSLDSRIEILKNNINQASGGHKLKLLDSLCWITRKKVGYKYDSIVKATIDYALKIDSTRLGLVHARSLVRYTMYNKGQSELSIEIFNNLKHKFSKEQNYKELAHFYQTAAGSYERSKSLEKAITLLEEAYTFAVKAKDSVLMGKMKERIGDAFCLKGDFEKAVGILQESIEIFDQSNSELIWRPKMTLAILHSQNGFLKEARKIRFENIVDAKKRENYFVVYLEFFNQAFDEMLHGSQKERLRNLDSAAVYVAKYDDEYSERELLTAQLSAYSESGFLSKANLVKQKLDNEKEKKILLAIDEYNLAMAQFAFAKGNYKEAVVWGEKQYAKFKNTNAYENIYLSNKFLSKVYDKLGDSKKSLRHFKAYSRIKDSIESVQKANGFSYYQTLLETEKKEVKIVKQESKIAVLNSKNRIKQQWLLFGGVGLLALFSLIYLFRSRKFTKTKQELQEQFSQGLINEQEKERTRLARELHDSVGQKLMLLTKVTKKGGSSEAENLASTTLDEVREISRGLHPSNLERLGLTEAINALIYSINANTDLFFSEEIENVDSVLSKEAELHLYRIIQETLSNIVKHAEAKAVKVDIQKNTKNIKVIVSDNGRGFDMTTKSKTASLGIKTLFERAKIIGAEMNLDSKVNKGTVMTLDVPMQV